MVENIEVTLLDFFNITNGYIQLYNYKPFKIYIKNKEGFYYNFTSKFFILLKYTIHENKKTKKTYSSLEKIIFARRDGQTEYNLFERARSLTSDKPLISMFFNQLTATLPKYLETKKESSSNYEKYLFDSKIKFNKEDNQYVILDVETNGLNYKDNDLLSFSFYDPSTGICYNRFLPLELQPLVLTSYINGIKEEDLYRQEEFSLEEFKYIVNTFLLDKKTILTFAPSNPSFDYLFLNEYLLRHNIDILKNFKFDNIYNYIPEKLIKEKISLKKDNLCNYYKIEGVKKIHDACNDCILEYQLFKKMINDK